MTKIPVKKLTPKGIMGHGVTDFTFKVPTAPTWLYRVYGAVDKFRTKSSQFDDNQTLLMGRFEAVRVSDGLVFESTNLYMPDKDVQEALANASKTTDGEVTPVEFAYMVGYQAGKSPTGYVWMVDAMTDTRTQDTLDSVRNLVSDTKLLAKYNLPALAAPDAKAKK